MGRTKRTTTNFYDLMQKVFAPFIHSLPTVDRKLAKELFSSGRKHMAALTTGTTPLQFQPMLLAMMLELYIRAAEIELESERITANEPDQD